MAFGMRGRVTRMFIYAIALGAAGKLAGWGFATFTEARIAKNIISYEGGMKKFTEELEENGLAVKDVAREAVEKAGREKKPFESVYPQLSEFLKLKPIERIRVIGRNGKSIRLKDYMIRNPAIRSQVPGLDKRILELNKMSKKASLPKGGRHWKDWYRLGGAGAGAMAGAALGCFGGRRKRNFEHVRK